MTMFCCHDQHYASSASICLHKAPIYLISFLPGYLWEGIHWAVLRIPRDFHMYMDYSALLFSPSFCTWSCRLIAWTMASMATGLDVLPTVESRPLYIMIRFQVRISLASHDLVIRGWSWNVALCVLLDHGYLCLNLMLQQGLWDCIVSCSCNFPSKKLFV